MVWSALDYGRLLFYRKVMKELFTIPLLVLCITMAANGQTIVAEDAIRERIVSVSANISSVECDFVQTRQSSLLADAAVSKGHMEYRKPGFLRWEYLSPINMEFCVNGQNVALKIDGSPKPIGNQSRSIKEMSKIIIANIEGNSLLNDSMFKNKVRQENGDIVVVLYPQNSRLKKMWAELVLTYNPKDFTVRSFIMKEMSGDITTIIFSGARYEFSE